MSEINFDLYFEYIDNADLAIAMAADKKWQAEVEAKQAMLYYRLITKLMGLAGIWKRVLGWL